MVEGEKKRVFLSVCAQTGSWSVGKHNDVVPAEATVTYLTQLQVSQPT